MADSPATEFALPDDAATARLGAALARAIEREADAIAASGLVVALCGELGAGKTSVVRAMLRALGVTGPVRSPTFTLVEPYVVSSIDFYHFDFYRLADPEEFSFTGFREMFGPGAVCLIEWPERAAGHVPEPDLRIVLRIEGEGRHASLTAGTKLGASCLQCIESEMTKRA
jgi:tRNA threonylcarbamoyladenosine biosynthesis protein TsaE